MTQKFSLILFLIMLSLALGWAVSPRLQQNIVIDKIYAQRPGVPFYATLDAPSFVSHAKEATRSGNYLRAPLLSAILARLSQFYPDKSHYYLANQLIPYLSVLFIIPLAIYFYLIGKPAIGLLGGLVGALNLDYMIRASVGRIDTDMLNLFFPFLASLFLLCFMTTRRQWLAYFYALLFAGTLYLFMWWYNKPVFAMIYGATFLLVLFLRKPVHRPLIFVLALITIFVAPFHYDEIFSQLGSIYHAYILNAVDSGPLAYPNISKTITEIRLMAPNQIFLTLLSHVAWGWLGLGLLLAIAITTGRKLLPLLPVLFMGLMCFWFGRRFGMYLAPFIGIGCGYGIYFLLDGIPAVKKFFGQIKFGRWWQEILAYGLAFVLTFFMTSDEARSFVPRPSVVPEIIQTYQLLKNQTPENARILTWWDDGYTIQDQAERRVYHDGGSHDGRKTYLVAKALSSKSQEELFQINRFMLAKSEDEIGQLDSSQETLNQAIMAETTESTQPSYLIYTWNTVKLFSAIYWIGQWDPSKQDSVAKGFSVLQCQQTAEPTLDCGRDNQINLKDGTYRMGKKTYKVQRLLQIEQGEIANEVDYHRDNGITLEVFPNGDKQNTLTAVVMEEVVYQTNFNQMFLLGKYDRQLFEEVSNRFPVSRLFKFRESQPSP